ncbi:hypothetical protein [Nocardioides massiliensis]|uniref:Uncharacterized protein n=1 Tax=Nocardioides massiliensis TaxID=1325935 RepID=A0ABT9NLT3_9ACTN|nr:hypothetical protein [Nocardioides massiliensis]MDP9821381.1 hypothetical protein [Nocardioides massiliensis]
MTTYSLVLPFPWKRLPVEDPAEAHAAARAFARHATRLAPPDVAPDERTRVVVELEGRLRGWLDQLRDSGTVDLYLPAAPLGGVSLNASFVVASVIPNATADASWVGPVHQALRAEGATEVLIDGHAWTRTDETIRSDGEVLIEAGLPARRISYTTAVPGDERRWAMVTATVIGDGDPTSDQTGLVVELFDAIMSTWRWDAVPVETHDRDDAGDAHPVETSS